MLSNRKGASEQGFCYLVDMNPPRRSKPGKTRPAVVIQSSDTLNAGSPGVVVVPLTSQLAEQNILRLRLNPSKDLKLRKPVDVLLDQIHTIDRSYFIENLGPVSLEDFEKIRAGVRFLLNF